MADETTPSDYEKRYLSETWKLIEGKDFANDPDRALRLLADIRGGLSRYEDVDAAYKMCGLTREAVESLWDKYSIETLGQARQAFAVAADEGVASEHRKRQMERVYFLMSALGHSAREQEWSAILGVNKDRFDFIKRKFSH